MNSDHPILVLEDSVVTSVAAGRVIEQALPGCRIVRAQSCFEAQLLLRIYDFRLFILDIHLPDGCGLDLIPTIVSRNPNAGIIVLTADPQPEYHNRSVAFGVRHFITKPFRAEALSDAARDSLNDVAMLTPDPASDERLFTASLRQLSVADILQLKCLNRTTTRLEVSTVDGELRIGCIDIEAGEVVNAEVRDSQLAKLAEGEAALAEIFAWHGGNIEEVPCPFAPEHTIDESWASLILNSAQRADEAVHEELVLQN